MDNVAELKDWLNRHTQQPSPNEWECLYCGKVLKGETKGGSSGRIYMPLQGLTYHYATLSLVGGHPSFWADRSTMAAQQHARETTVPRNSSEGPSHLSPDPAVRLPTPWLNAYLNNLPNGLDSYPEAQSRTAMVTSFIQELLPYLSAEGLRRVPDEMVDILLAGLRQESGGMDLFFSEVHFMALVAMSRDIVFSSDAAYIGAIRKSMQRYVKAHSSSALLALYDLGHWSVGGNPQASWLRLKRGTALNQVAVGVHPLSGKSSITMRLSFPPGLYERYMLTGFAESIKVMIEEELPSFLKVVFLHGVQAHVDVTGSGPTHADFLIDNPA